MSKKATFASRSRRGALVPKAILDKRGANIPSTSGNTLNAVALLADLRSLIHSARKRVATVANSAQTMLYWHVGRRLLKENLQEGRAAYGKRILVTVSQELKAEFGDAFSYSSLTRMVRFAESFVDEAIVATLSQQLSWSHFLAILPIKDPLARDFYAEMCRIEHWDIRTFRDKIGSMLFQRTALSKPPKAAISSGIANLRDGRMTPDLVFRDPYLLDFLGLKGAYSERDLENAILREIEGVLLESNRILGVNTAQWRQVDLSAQLQTTRLDAEGGDRCCLGIEQSIFAAPHIPNFRLLSC